MEFRDLFITPIYLIVFYGLAYFFRPYFTDKTIRKYFIPALTLKFIGAIALGLIYQFYYNGGDTFNYFTNGSKWIWNAFLDDPLAGLELLFSSGGRHQSDTFKYSQHIWYYKDSHSYVIVRLTAFFDLFTFHTYSATALFFSIISFIGSWSLFKTFNRLYPKSNFLLAISILFVPSVIFWGSGILKDSITFSFLGLATYSIYNIFYFNRRKVLSILILIVSFWMIYSIKIYILLTFILGFSVWLYSLNIDKIKSKVLKLVIAPFILLIFIGLGYLSINYISAGDQRYSLDKIAQTAAITANDIRYGWGARTGDTSGYDLGELDGSFGSMIRLAPAAINVSLFRPYLWEVKNPLMLLSAMESFIITFFTLYFLYKGRSNILQLFRNPHLRFCLVFSITFAFAVGVSTYNFGTLMRYKIPMMPYYALFLVILSQNEVAFKKGIQKDNSSLK